MQTKEEMEKVEWDEINYDADEEREKKDRE